MTPTTVRALLDVGYTVNVERSPNRIFDDEEFEVVGATLVAEGSWVHVPKDHIIIGLKELPESNGTELPNLYLCPSPSANFYPIPAPILHPHIQFGHCYKNQEGWDRYLSRFARGGGTLYDIEFLTDESGRRISAFGYYAGYAGAAVALLAWSSKILYPTYPFPALPEYHSETALVATVTAALARAISENGNRYPRILVMGALGRCGSGAVDLCLQAGIPSSDLLKWDMADTAAGGPFPEIATSDIFINCVYLQQKVPPFVTFDSLAKPGRKLRIACDVSCDYNSPNNPMPIYHQSSTFARPTLPVEVDGDLSLDVISIDNLPSLVAREASEAFSWPMLPSLKVLHRRHEEGVWLRAEALFREKVSELPADVMGS